MHTFLQTVYVYIKQANRGSLSSHVALVEWSETDVTAWDTAAGRPSDVLWKQEHRVGEVQMVTITCEVILTTTRSLVEREKKNKWKQQYTQNVISYTHSLLLLHKQFQSQIYNQV